jgi:magnesium chelatase family protein
MMDRIDIMIEVPKVKTQDFSSKTDFSKIENSASIRQRVYLAREKQLKRFSGLKITSNSQMSSKEINQFCQLDDM